VDSLIVLPARTLPDGTERFHVAFTPAMPPSSRRGPTICTVEKGVVMMKVAKAGLANAWTLNEGEEPPLAAHLVTPRRGYIHHGLYVGHGRIIHYPGVIGGFRRRAVEEVSLAEFARGRPVAVRTDSNPRFDREDVVRRARSRLGENRYHIIRNNCEHFCEWCLSGVSRSRQLESLLGRAGAAAIAIMPVVAAWAHRVHSQIA
jgi:Lecithin retinol acyltransferase